MLLINPVQVKADDNIPEACKATANFLIVAGGYKLGSYLVSKAAAKGFGATGAYALNQVENALTDFLATPCEWGMEKYIEYWRSKDNLSYDDYLEIYCNGDAFLCNDPNLNISCSLNPYQAQCELQPWECQFFGQCLPYITQIGVRPVSVLDLYNSLGLIEMSYHLGYWDNHVIEQVSVSFSEP